MPSASDGLTTARLPRFFLLKDLRDNYTDIVSFDIEEFVTDGVLVESFYRFDEAMKLVPQPIPPKNAKQSKRLEHRIDAIMGVDDLCDPWLADRPVEEFDTDPLHNSFMVDRSLASDIEVYGQGYTILWVCSPDVRTAVARLMAEVYHLAGGSVDIPVTSDFLDRLGAGQITPPRGHLKRYDLGAIWDQFIGRLCFHAPDLQVDVRNRLYSEVVGEFRRLLSQVPWGAPALKEYHIDEEMYWK